MSGQKLVGKECDVCVLLLDIIYCGACHVIVHFSKLTAHVQIVVSHHKRMTFQGLVPEC